MVTSINTIIYEITVLSKIFIGGIMSFKLSNKILIFTNLFAYK